jgi:hypothetical protein
MNIVNTVNTMSFSNFLDMLPDDCMEKIQLNVLNFSCDHIDNSIEDIIDILLEVVEKQYTKVKKIKESKDRLTVAFALSAFRNQLNDM